MLPRGLLKEYSQVIAILQRLLDMMAVFVAGWIAYYWWFDNFEINSHYITALLVASISTALVFNFFHIYDSIRAKSAWQHIQSLTQAIALLLIVLAGLAFFTKTGETYSRGWFVTMGIFSLIFLLAFRISLLIVLRYMRFHGMNEKRVIIIGGGSLGFKLAETIHQALWTGFKITAIFDDDPDPNKLSIQGIPVIKTPKNLGDYLNTPRKEIDEVWITLPLRAEERVKTLLHDLRHHTVVVRYALNIFGLGLFKHNMTEIDGFPMLNLNSSPMFGLNRLIKAIEDRLIAAIILLLISPIGILIALAIKVSSKGPIFFKQHRHGWDGKIIKVYKFRTMKLHQEEEGKVTQASLNDDRITAVGKFLRKTSLDELPQFFNVLQGRMSIVGPRPHAIVHNEYYKDSIHAYMQRHKVKPGITGWAQINGWRGETDTLEKMQKRVEYDLYYIDNWSLGFDLKIIFFTFFQGFINKNAY